MTSAKPMRQSQLAGDPDPRWTAIATRDTRSDGHRPDRIPIPGADIRFAIVKSALGYLLVARSAKGVCAVLMGDSPSLLERDLRQRFPQVRLLGSHADTESLAAEVARVVENPRLASIFPWTCAAQPSSNGSGGRCGRLPWAAP